MPPPFFQGAWPSFVGVTRVNSQLIIIMSSILESMSTRKLCYFMGALVFLELLTILLGGVISPKPNNSMEFTATKCIDQKGDTAR